MTPTSKDVDRALELASKLYANYVYLFERLESPEWIEPLQERGRFASPPPPIVHADGAQSFPTWPESQFLVRMAKVAPEEVFSVLQSLPETANVMVHRDIVDAALALPLKMGAEIAAREAAWARRQDWLFWLIPEKFAELVKSLAEGGAGAAASDLMSATLEPRPDGLPKMQYHDYERVLEIATVSLAHADPWTTLEVLADLLARSVKRDDAEANGFDDMSAIWRPAVEDHKQNRYHDDVRDALVSALRDAAERIAVDDPASVRMIVDRLEQRRSTIFRRIALYVLARHPVSGGDVARARLMGVRLMDDVHVRHEYAQLAKAALSLLTPSEQSEVLGAASSFFDETSFRTRFEAGQGRPPTDDEIRRAHEADEREHLALFEGTLQGEWKARYEDIVSRLGGVEHPDFPYYSRAAFIGPTSPRSADDLARMSVEELVEFLKTWKPSGDLLAPSYEGLGRQLQEVVQRDPARYAGAARSFIGLEPTYVRLFIEGFDQGLRGGKAVAAWDPLLQLCEFVVAQPRGDAPHFDDRTDRDLTWHWTQHAVTRLITEAVAQTGEAELAQRYAGRAWKLLRALARDPDPTPADEARYGGDNMEPLTYSLNVVRGSVMHGVVRYALWRRRGIEREAPQGLERGFDAMPEVAPELEWHLDPSNDPSLAIHAVYGQWFAWLVLLDRRWAEQNAARIFPPSHPALRDAAWNAYLQYSPAYDTPFDILEREYRRAVEALPSAAPAKRRYEDSRENLAGHLAAVFIRGRLTWESHGGLLARFFEIAPIDVRAVFVETLGRIVKDAPNELHPEQLERLHDLFERRLALLAGAPAQFAAELAPFAWWYASGRTGFPWAIEQLVRLLTAGGTLDPSQPVLERLAVDAPSAPMTALRVLLALVQKPPERWMLVAVDDELRAIVRAGIAAGGETATFAGRVIDELAARGVVVRTD